MAEGFKINSEESLNNCVLWLSALFKKHKYIKLSAACGKRSLDQNALVYRWYADIAAQKQDMTPLEARCITKLHIGVPLLRSENEAFCAHWDKFVKGSATYEEKLEAMKFMDITSILTSPQMTKYLDQMQCYWRDQGIFLESINDR